MDKTVKLFSSYALCTLAGILFGGIIFGGKVMELFGFSLIEILIYPNLMCVVIFALWRRTWAAAGGGGLWDFYRQPLAVTSGYALACVMMNVGQYAPLFAGISVSLVLFMMYLQPMWTIVFGTIFLKEKFTGANAAACAMSIAGLALLLAPWRGGVYSPAGIIIAILGGMGLSGWVLMNSHFSKKGFSPAIQAMVMNINQSVPFIIALPFLTMIFPNPAVSGIARWGAAPLLCVFLFALAVHVAAHMLFYKAEQKISAAHAGLIILIEPVVGTMLDVLALGSPFSWNMAAGGFLILIANARVVLMNNEQLTMNN
jgi:drug/metabolite transporter (DMT)-like permease